MQLLHVHWESLTSDHFVFHAIIWSESDFVPNFTPNFSHRNWLFFFPSFLQLHTADIGGRGTTSEVVQSIMRIIQSKGQLTADL